MATRNGAISRRRLLASATAAGAATFLGGIAKPYLSRAADRPNITHGIQSGDISVDSGIVWARTDRPARMIVEAATTDSFKTIIRRVSVDAPADSDFTAKALLEGLPSGQDIFYRVAFENLSSPTIIGEPQIGRFRSAPTEQRTVSFVWSGDTMGGWGIDESRGGMRTYATMLRNSPDFFIHCGDNIYAECPLGPEQKLPNGEIWRNIVTDEKSRVAETLADYRGNYKYNLLDRNLRAFNAEVPTFAQWDDHEVTNDWYPGMPLRVGESDITALAARGCRAFHEFLPTRQSAAERGRIYRKIAYGPLLDVFILDMRSYRGPNGERKQETYTEAAHFLGPEQVAWLKRELAASRATWKVIAADLPIGLLNYDSIGQGDGPPLGRELEIADLLRFMKHAGVRNTVWITADMHYTAAHHFDPNRAVFQDFEPFWEFMSGPIHAGTGTVGVLDNTFGPRTVYYNACSAEQGDDLAPCFGLQFFGHVAIDGASGVMTVTLKDVADRDLWSIELTPRPGIRMADVAPR
jgi:alkaline phosphatase D